MGCYLRILGDFDPEQLLSDHQVHTKSAQTWTKGDPYGKAGKWGHSGIQFLVSKAPRRNHRTQFRQAAAFLSANKDWLRQLTKDPRVQESLLDFGLSQDPHPAYYKRLPLPLIQWSAVCGVEIEISLHAIAASENDTR